MVNFLSLLPADHGVRTETKQAVQLRLNQNPIVEGSPSTVAMAREWFAACSWLVVPGNIGDPLTLTGLKVTERKSICHLHINLAGTPLELAVAGRDGADLWDIASMAWWLSNCCNSGADVTALVQQARNKIWDIFGIQAATSSRIRSDDINRRLGTLDDKVTVSAAEHIQQVTGSWVF